MKKKVRRTSKKFLSILLTLLLTVALLPAVVAHGETTVSFDVLRTAINPGYYFSGILIDMGIPLKACLLYTSCEEDACFLGGIPQVHQGGDPLQGVPL